MRNIFESSEVFEAHARIDYCYFMIRKLINEIGKPVSPLERQIDIVTGHEDAQVKNATQQAIELLEEVIASKKTINADYSGDETFLKQLKYIS